MTQTGGDVVPVAWRGQSFSYPAAEEPAALIDFKDRMACLITAASGDLMKTTDCLASGWVGTCARPPPTSPPALPPSSPSPLQCKGLKDVIKRGKNKCKLVEKCSKKKITKKCTKGCRKDVCQKLKKDGTCKKKGKKFCLKTCCDAVGSN